MRGLLVVVLVVACTPPPLDAGSTGSSSSTGFEAATDATTSTGDTAPTTTSETGDTGSPPPPGVCPSGDVILQRQSDVEAVAGCTEFPGGIKVLRDVTDLSPLAGVRRIAGTLAIGGLDWDEEAHVTSLAAFSELERLGGLDLTKVDVSHLLAFSNLTEVTGSLKLWGLQGITSLEGLHHVTDVGGELDVSICESLVDLDGLRGLRRVGRGLHLSNLQIADIDGLESLAEVGAPDGEPVHVSLYMLPNLASLDALRFDWHPAIDLNLYKTAVSSLDFLAGVTELHGLMVDSNPITSLGGLEALERVSGQLDLRGDGGPLVIDALANLQEVGTFDVIDDAFGDLSPLVSLARIGTLTYRADATDMGTLPALQELGHFTAFYAENLTSLSALSGLTSLESLTLERTVALTELAGLTALVEVEGDVTIRDNSGLTGLTGAPALKKIGGRLKIAGNESLPQADAEQWAEAIEVVGARKIGDNKDSGEKPEPCPWYEDGECDEDVCAPESDGEDCPCPCE